MMARRLMMASPSTPPAARQIWIGGPNPTFGNLTSSRGGLWTSSIGPDGFTKLTVQGSPRTGICYSYSGSDTYGYLSTSSLGYKKVDRASGAVVASRVFPFPSDETTYPLKQILKDRIILIKSSSPAGVFSLPWSGTQTQFPDSAIPTALRNRVGTIDGSSAIMIGSSVAANSGSKTVHLRSASAVNGGGIDYDCYGISTASVPTNNSQYAAVIGSASGAVTLRDFEIPPEFIAPPVDGPVYSRDDITTFSAFAYNVDGGILVLGKHVSNRYHWDGTRRTASQVNASQRVSYEATVGVAHKTTNFLARIDANGAFNVVARLSKTSWWYDYQDVALTGSDYAIVSGIWWYGKYNAPRTINYDPTNFSGIGAAPLSETGFANSDAAPLTWELPAITYVDKELSSIVVTIAGNGYWRLSSAGADFLNVTIPAGTGGKIGILQREKAWILRRTGSPGSTFELSYATAQEFASRAALDPSNSFASDNPDQLELI